MLPAPYIEQHGHVLVVRDDLLPGPGLARLLVH